jgi:hypothetical protein
MHTIDLGRNGAVSRGFTPIAKSLLYADLLLRHSSTFVLTREQQIELSMCGTPEHAYIDLNNCMVNTSGKEDKFLGRDKESPGPGCSLG